MTTATPERLLMTAKDAAASLAEGNLRACALTEIGNAR